MRKILLAAMACLLGSLACIAAPPKIVYVRCGKLIFRRGETADFTWIRGDHQTEERRRRWQGYSQACGAEKVDLFELHGVAGIGGRARHISSGPFWEGRFQPAGGAARRQGNELTHCPPVLLARASWGQKSFIDIHAERCD